MLIMVGICDADASQRKMIREYVEKFFFDKTDVVITEYEGYVQMTDFASSGISVYDLVILDADRCGGLAYAGFVKTSGICTDIIVYTETAKYVFDGYKYGIFDFVLKNGEPDDLGVSLLRYVNERLDSNTEYLSIKANGCVQNIRLDKIYYFESRGRKLAAVTADEKIEFYQKMDELIEVLPGNSFVRCHHSYSVNSSAVYSFSGGELILKNGQTIPVSRKYYLNVKSIFQMSNLT